MTEQNICVSSQLPTFLLLQLWSSRGLRRRWDWCCVRCLVHLSIQNNCHEKFHLCVCQGLLSPTSGHRLHLTNLGLLLLFPAAVIIHERTISTGNNCSIYTCIICILYVLYMFDIFGNVAICQTSVWALRCIIAGMFLFFRPPGGAFFSLLFYTGLGMKLYSYQETNRWYRQAHLADAGIFAAPEV